jgi:cytochrome c553
MQNKLALIPLTLLVLNAAPAISGDAAAGKVKAATCAACHGANGISGNNLWPNLAGQKQGYLAAQLTAFRDGARNNPVMSPMAAGLSDADIADLSAYYASLGK